jgi:hypothetical protein
MFEFDEDESFPGSKSKNSRPGSNKPIGAQEQNITKEQVTNPVCELKFTKEKLSASKGLNTPKAASTNTKSSGQSFISLLSSKNNQDNKEQSVEPTGSLLSPKDKEDMSFDDLFFNSHDAQQESFSDSDESDDEKLTVGSFSVRNTRSSSNPVTIFSRSNREQITTAVSVSVPPEEFFSRKSQENEFGARPQRRKVSGFD